MLLFTVVATSQPELVARGVTEARYTGDESSLVHLADEIGSSGVAECLENAGRSGRMVCAEAARYVSHWWPTLLVLAQVLDDHDRQVASRAAESMVVILHSVQSGDLGPQEPVPEEAEAMLERLRSVSGNRRISLEIRVLVVATSGFFARLVGAGLEVPRGAVSDPEVAVRRAAVRALMGSSEADDVSALVEATAHDGDLLVASQAATGVCEVTLIAGSSLPEPVEERIRALLADSRARPSQITPLLACIARSEHPQADQFKELAARHPNEASRQVWVELNREGE